MPLVFLHGVPEDLHVWDDLLSELSDLDTVALGLPGFCAPLPTNFRATKEGYIAWLIAALEGFAEPVDLVGHDWGGILTSRIATARPDLVRSFATDVLAFFHPEFTWHPLAKVWATPGAGEAFMEEQGRLSVDERAAQYVAMGVSTKYARRLAIPDSVKTGCILELYRSSTALHLDWGANAAPPTVPGLHLVGAKDPFAAAALSGPVRQRFDMKQEVIEGAGHFWPSQDPKAGARAIRRFVEGSRAG